MKCLDFVDEEDKEGNRPQRTSVRKKPAEKHKSLDLLESPSQDWRSDNSKNFQKEKRRSRIKSFSSSANESAKGKQKIKAAKPLTDSKTHIFPTAVNSSSCLSSPADLDETVVELSKQTSTLPLQKMEQKTPKRARLSLSSTVQSFIPSGNCKSVYSCSTDRDDNVFEDFFSPANHQKSKTSLLPDIQVGKDIQIPFELDSGPKKRKQRRSESLGSENNSQKKKKLEKSQGGKNCNQPSDASREPQSPSQQHDKESLPELDRSGASVTLLAKRQRQNALPFTSTRATNDAETQRTSSTSVHSAMCMEANTVSELQKNSDVSVYSHTLESE